MVFRLPVIFGLVLALGACATTLPPAATPVAGGGVRNARVVSSASVDSAAVARARADSVLHPYTQADIHFMSGMIGHHAQALEMAAMVPSHGASAAVRTLAARIVNAQQDEIATMQRWLRERRQPVPDARGGPIKMQMGGMEHTMAMPGMLTESQMKQLDQARGPTFDHLFLIFMIQHHRGAVTMVRQLLDSPGAAQSQTVFKLASDVQVDQLTEIARMQAMLDAMRESGSVQ